MWADYQGMLESIEWETDGFNHRKHPKNFQVMKKETEAKEQIKIRILKWLRRNPYQRENWAYLRKDQESSQRNKRRSLKVTESKYLHLFICWDHSYILINLSMTLSDIVATVRVFFFFWFNNLLYRMQEQTVVLTTKWIVRSLCYVIPSLKEKAFGLYLRKETNWLIVSLIGFQ